MKKPQQRPPAPWEHAPWGNDDALAVQALEKGIASPAQQQRALNWIINASCLTEQSFIPMPKGDAYGRVDAFVEGKRQIGRQIRNLLRVNLQAISE